MSTDTTHFAAPANIADAPAWFNTLRAASWQDYTLMPAPTRREESWRFASLKKADLSPFVVADANAGSADSASDLESAAELVFSNDSLVSQTADLPDGVTCIPLSEAINAHSDLVEKHLCKSATKLGSAKFAALHASQLTNGIFIHVPAGVEVEKPILIQHLGAGENGSTFPHTLVIAEANSAVKVVETFSSADSAQGLVIAMNDLIAGEGAKLDYVAIQNLNTASKIFQLGNTIVAKDARAKAFVLNLGAEWARNESYSSLAGEGAHSDMLSVNVPFGSQEFDQRTFQHHQARNATSDLLYKNSLYDKSKTVFSGLIFVDEGAHQTDAYQTCRNLFMSDDAEANSMPGLEINADDVACSHGSTSAQVSEEEIFYLQARGVPTRQAKQMIARGFSVEAIERLEDEEIESLILRFLDAKFTAEL